jgi:uncharacterized lipoprotein YehR (DUF1307 family)
MMKNVKKAATLVLIATLSISMYSCKKCHECHYEIEVDGEEAKVDIGEFCGKDLKKIEKEGKEVNGTKYDVHCHDH